jgi:excisionase family DNA binding protein
MKRFYTVKEAAEILGFSTNTIYKYLDEGKLKGKRIGKGRFKIPYEELEPYLSVGEKVEHVVSEKVQGDKIAEAIKEVGSEFKGIASGYNDFIFFRLFVGIVILGGGLIHLFWLNGLYPYTPIVRILYSFGLIFAGLLFLISSIFWKKSKTFNVWGHILSLIMLLGAIVISLLLKNYQMTIAFVALLLVLVSHLARGYENCCEHSTFYRDFIFYTLLAALGFLILVFIAPDSISFSQIAQFTILQKIIFTAGWMLFMILPAIYLLSAKVKNPKILLTWILAAFITSLIVAIGASIRNEWDISFGAFIYGIFAGFLLWWSARGSQIDEKELHLVIISFFWIALVTFLGLLSIQIYQKKQTEVVSSRMQARLSEIVRDIDYLFAQPEGIINTEIKKGEIANVILRGNEEEIISLAKAIFDKFPDPLNRILILDSQGKALGVYPRNSLVQGGNFSSQEYFLVPKKSLRPYISNVFEAVIGIDAVALGVPVFNDNHFAGVVAAGYDLGTISQRYQNLGSGGTLYAYDENQRYTLNIDSQKIGQEVGSEIPKDTSIKDNVLRVFDWVAKPRWAVYIERDLQWLFRDALSVNIIISSVIVLNAASSLAAGFVLAKKWKKA